MLFTPELPSISTAVGHMKWMHADQVDKRGNPYWPHPIAVMNLLPENASHKMKLVALLHDTIEDWKDPVEAIKRLYDWGYTPDIVTRVVALSRIKGDKRTYLDYIRNIAESGDEILLYVKLADNIHNSLPSRMVGLLEDDRAFLTKRYDTARKILTDALGLDPIDPADYDAPPHELLKYDGLEGGESLINRTHIWYALAVVFVGLVVALLVSPILAFRATLLILLVAFMWRVLKWVEA